MQSMGASMWALSPHRCYGPKGVGVLYRHRRARLTSLLHGSTQEDGRRAGTENVPAIVGAGVAAEIAMNQLDARQEHTGALQRRLWEGFNRSIENIQLNGPPPGTDRIPTNLNVSSEFVEGEGQLLLCDTKGIAVASGSNCVSKAVKNSHVLEGIGLDPGLAQGHVIFSLGKENSEEEIDYVIETFAQVVAKLRGMSPLWDEYQRGMVNSAIRTTPKPADQTASSRA
jgi:cysteine desulfurase